MISFSENHVSDLIAFENSRPLASLLDPREEALKWVYSLGHIPTSHVVVIGLGSGFHIAALAELDPRLRITVIETREVLLPIFRSQFPEIEERVDVTFVQNIQDLFKTEAYGEVLRNRSLVLSFRECWGAHSESFTELFAHLTGRSVDSVKYHFEDLGINMKALFFDNSRLLNIKDVLPVVEASPMAEGQKQLFRVLGELVK